MDAYAIELTHKIEEANSTAQTNFINLGYRPELDGFRGISIILVFIHHVYHTILPGGFLGVDMFFVLSGFLITSLLLQEWQRYNTISLKNFYIRRLFRLMPAVLFLILILTFYAVFFLDATRAKNIFQGIWLTLSYSSNWFYAFDSISADNPLGVTWSLAIEEQFYFIFPIVLYFALRFKFGHRQIIGTLIFLIIAVALNRRMLADQGATVQRLYYASDTRADALLVGCLVAFVCSRNLLPFKKLRLCFQMLALLSLGFLIFMIAVADSPESVLYYPAIYSFVAFSVAALLLFLVVYQPRNTVRVLSFSPLVWIGRISYGLYLWHWAVRYFVYEKQSLPESNLQLVFVITASFALTVLSYYCIEKPFLHLKDRFSRTHSLVSN